MSYYHDSKMENIFEVLKQPKTLEEIQLSESFVNGIDIKNHNKLWHS